MPWDDWRTNLNKKLDGLGENTMNKVRQQRESGGSTSIKERLQMAKGQNPQWDRDVEERRNRHAQETEDGSSSQTHSRVPPPPPSRVSNSHVTPPPPSRVNNSQVAPPPPPPRMNNENGTANPPPAYNPTALKAAPTDASRSYIEFSKFTEQDKQSFFTLLDEYFEQAAQR